MRKKDKIEKYIEKLLKSANLPSNAVTECERSRYYNVNGRILRISDHIGMASSGNMSIILPSFGGFGSSNQYIIHAHTEGSTSIVTYEQVKKIVFSFIACSSFMLEITQKNTDLRIDKKDELQVVTTDTAQTYIDKLNKFLTKGQRKTLKSFIKQNSKS